MYLSSAVRKRIDQLCDDRDITINKMCTICGITQSTLANINSRPNTNFNIFKYINFFIKRREFWRKF